ncbi:MAG TPA: hypothetical protein VMJ32_17535, partial [Pirellulales bacterium]|nr:hypothetical protein [Pirellulales bacterium]
MKLKDFLITGRPPGKIIFRAVITNSPNSNYVKIENNPDLQLEFRNAIQRELLYELRTARLQVTQIEIVDEGEGSWWIEFAVALGAAYTFVAQYHDFYESVVLIRRQARAILRRIASATGTILSSLEIVWIDPQTGARRR